MRGKRRMLLARAHGQALLLVIAGLTGCLLGASQASAKAPTGDYAPFVQCPRFTPSVRLCAVARVEGGRVTFNGLSVPMTNPIMLQGGTTFNEETEAETFVGPLNGETLSKAPENVPGGLQGLLSHVALPKPLNEAYEEAISGGLTGVTGTTELATPAGEIGVNKDNIVNEEGVGLSLPVKIHLENPLLGAACYIGSRARPIFWNLMTGETSTPPPNKPIRGSVGDLEFGDEARLIELIGGTLVDNSYAVPAANGCGGALSSVLDPVIDAKIGLPAAAGHNTTVLKTTVQEALTQTVMNSEK